MENTDNFNSKSDNQNIEKGDLLIASPLIKDIHFDHSVVLILDKDANNGYLGLTLNKKLNFSLGNLFPKWKNVRDIPIFSGGPVDYDRMFMLHTLGNVFENSIEIKPGLYLGGNIDDISQYLEFIGDYNNKIRFFIGYGGWEKNQLEDEIKNNSWAVLKKNNYSDILSDSGIRYWERMVKTVDAHYHNWLLVPPDPRYN